MRRVRGTTTRIGDKESRATILPARREPGSCMVRSSASQRSGNAEICRSDFGFLAKNTSVNRRRCSCRSAKVILLSWRLEARRQRRDSATASKVFFFVVMDQEGWRYNTHGRITLQDIHCIEAGFASSIREMFEIPAHQIVQSCDRAERHMKRIITALPRNDLSREIGLRQFFRLRRAREHIILRNAGA